MNTLRGDLLWTRQDRSWKYLWETNVLFGLAHVNQSQEKQATCEMDPLSRSHCGMLEIGMLGLCLGFFDWFAGFVVNPLFVL